MSLSRSDRNDRRRRIVRELSSTDSVQSPSRARRSPKSSSDRDEDVRLDALRSNAGYSLEVRHACKQRLSQFIPIRPASWAIYAMTGWLIWAMLLVAHFVTHGRNARWAQSPFFEIFHIRHSHSIANWLGTQLWLLTALTCFLVYRFRKHRLDDYRATYRIWLALVALSLFCSVDASCSLLYRLGWSIDPWCRSELGYPGWSIVFVGFAVAVGFVALRLITEIKSSPLCVAAWLAGLIAWGVGAALGTGLIHTTWSQLHLDLLVGGAWLGGILSVWLSALTFLRHVYIQAQRRFRSSDSILADGVAFKLPSIQLPRWRRRESTSEADDGEAKLSPSLRISKTAVIDRDIPPSESIASERKKGWTTWLSRSSIQDEPEAKSTRPSDPSNSDRPEKLPESTSARPIAHSRPVPTSKANDPSGIADDSVSKSSRLSRLQFWKSRADSQTTSALGSEKESEKNTSRSAEQPSKPNRGLGSFMTKSNTSHLNSSENPSSKLESRPSPSHSPAKPKLETASTNASEKSKESKFKSLSPSRLMRLVKRKPKPLKTDHTAQRIDSSTSKNPKPRGRFFGLFDGLKLKPPSDVTSEPSKSMPTGPQAISQTVTLPSTKSVSPRGQEEIDDSDRHLSRAERKKLRREQNRRAA